MFELQFEPAAICFQLRYSVSYTKIELWPIIIYEKDFMKVEIYIGLNCKTGINTQFKNTLKNYVESDIITQRLVLLSVDWDENGLLITERLHLMNKIIGYSYS